jgi:integrase
MVRAGEQKAHEHDPRTDLRSAAPHGRSPTSHYGRKADRSEAGTKDEGGVVDPRQVGIEEAREGSGPFQLAIDSKLRACDLTAIKVEDVAAGGEVKTRGIIVQKKTGRPVQFEITEQTRTAVGKLIHRHYRRSSDYLFPSRLAGPPHLSTRQYARIVQDWVRSIGLNPAAYGTHSLRRTKAALIYRKTGNLRAVQLLLGHSKLESTVRYLGVEVDDAIAISEGVDL